MKVNRSKFVQHLARLECGGQFTEVVFHKGFAVKALSVDHLLAVIAPNLEGAAPLPKEIGVTNLGRLAKALRLTPGEGNVGVDVDVYVDDNRLVIDDASRGGAVQRLVLAEAKTVSTQIDAETADQLFSAIADGKPATLTRAVLEGVCAAFGLYKAEEVEIRVGAEGIVICVGTEKTDRAEFTLDDRRQKETYSLLFGKHLISVFAIINDFSSAKLRLNGPAAPVMIEDGEYKYMLSPRSRSVEEGKPEVRGRKDEEQEEAPDEVPSSPKARARARVNARAAEKGGKKSGGKKS